MDVSNRGVEFNEISSWVENKRFRDVVLSQCDVHPFDRLEVLLDSLSSLKPVVMVLPPLEPHLFPRVVLFITETKVVAPSRAPGRIGKPTFLAVSLFEGSHVQNLDFSRRTASGVVGLNCLQGSCFA